MIREFNEKSTMFDIKMGLIEQFLNNNELFYDRILGNFVNYQQKFTTLSLMND